MSLILDALRKAQQIRMERQQRERSFGTSPPWLPRWRKRWVIPRKLLVLLVLPVAIAILFIIYNPGAHKPPAPVSQSSSMVVLPISQSPPEEMKEKIIEVPLEEVPLMPVSPPSTKGEAGGGGGKTPREVARAIPKTAPQPEKAEASFRERSTQRQVSIQPVPSQEAINHFNLGLLYHKSNKLSEALEEYKKALELDPLNVQAHNNLGMVYKELGRLSEAISQYQKAISINPNYEKAHHNLGMAYYLQGDWEKAVMEFMLAIDCNPKNPETYNNLGLIYRKQKDFYRAQKMFEKGLSIAPNYAPIHYNLALTLEDEGDWKGAALHFRKFVELYPDDQQELVQKVKRHLEALSYYEKQ